MSKLTGRSLNRKIGKSINRLIVSCLVGAMAFTAQAATRVGTEAKWTYSDTSAPGVFTGGFTNDVTSANDRAVIYEVVSGAEATLRGGLHQDYGGMVKLGAGKLTVDGNSYLASGYEGTMGKFTNLLTLDDTGNSAIDGISVLSILEGTFAVTNTPNRFDMRQTKDRLIIGGYTVAADGSGGYEKDVICEVWNGGYVNATTATELGMRHGFVGNTAADHPALARLVIYKGGTYDQEGGKEFLVGTTDVISGHTYHNRLEVIADGGTYTMGSSWAKFKVGQRNGQESVVEVKNGGLFHAYYVQTGVNSGNGESAPLTISVTGENSRFENQYFENNYNKQSGPTTTINLSNGAKFCCDEMMNCANGVIDISIDNATLCPLGVENKHCVTNRKVVVASNVSSLVLGSGGAKLYASGQNYGPKGGTTKEPNIAVFAGAFTGVGGLEISAQSAAHTVELTGANTYSGATVLKSGLFTVSGNGVIPAASDFTQEGGILFADSKDIELNNAIFKEGAVIRLSPDRKIVVNGTLKIEGAINIVFVDAEGNEITTGLTDMAVISTTSANAAELRKLATATYTSSKVAGAGINVEVSGGTAVFKASVTADATTATWNGAGSDDDFLTAANWKDGLPSFAGGLTATFAEGGASASFTGVKTLAGMVFNREGGFKVSAGDDALLYLGGNGIAITDTSRTATEIYEVAAPVKTASALAIAVPAKARLDFTKEFASSAGMTLSGAGEARFLGPTTEVANLTVNYSADKTVTMFSGCIRNADHTINTAVDSSGSAHTIHLCGQTKNYPIPTVISNVVFEKGVYIDSGDSDCSFMDASPGTTNIFKGGFKATAPYRKLRGGKDSAYIFDSKVNFGWTAKLQGVDGKATFIFRNHAMCGECLLVLLENSHAIFEVAGNECKDRLMINGASAIADFQVDHAFLSTMPIELYNYAATLELNDTEQCFKYMFGTAPNVTINGSEGSRFVILDTQVDPTGTTNLNCKVTGAVGVTMGGSGTLRLKSQAFASTGPLTATNGVLELCSGATWLNGTNFHAVGNGTIKFADKTQIEQSKAMFHFADNGKVYIPEGVTLRVKAAEVIAGGVATAVADGLYDGTGGALAGRITGGGKLRVLAYNPYDVDTEGGKYAYTYPYYFVTVPQGESNSLASAVYTITKVVSADDVDGTAISYDDFKTLTSGTFFKKGKGVLELNEAIDSWAGQIHVLEGMLLANTKGCLGKQSSSIPAPVSMATFVHNGATLYMDNRASNKPEYKRIVLEGTGVDGRGALLGNQGSSNMVGWDVGMDTELTGDATMRILRDGWIFNYASDPGGQTFHQNGYTATICGDAANAGSGFRVNNRTVEAGNLVLSNVIFVLQYAAAFESGAANYIRLIGKSRLRADEFYSKGKDRTLIVDDFDYALINSGDDNRWAGPVALNCDMPFHCTSSQLRGSGCNGYVSGNGGFPIYNADTKNINFHLACPTNSFKGIIANQSGIISLHANGAAPVDCAGIVMTNSTLRLYGTEIYRLPVTSFHGAGMITNDDAICAGSFVRLAKTGAGELAMASAFGADELILEAGGIRVNDDVPAAKMPVFGTVRPALGTYISAPHPVTITNGLVYAADKISTSTTALTVTGDLVFGAGATIDIPDISKTGNYRLLSVSGTVTGMPSTTKAGDPLVLEEGTVIVQHVNPYDPDPEGGKYAYTYPYYFVTVPQGGSNSLASAAYPIVKVTSAEDLGTAIGYAEFKTLTSGTFFKRGLGTLEMNEALENWAGQIHVLEGILLANVSKALGILNAGTAYATYVHDGATLYMDNRQNLASETKRIVFEGTGVDGRGALLGNQASNSDLGWDVGTEPTLSGDATMRVLRSGNLFNFIWSPAGTLHLNGHTATMCGDAANAGSGFRINSATVEEGNIILSNMTFTIYGNSPAFKGGAENYIRLTAGSRMYIDNFGASSPNTSKTLIFDDCGRVTLASGYGTDFSTSICCWEGPAVLNCNVPIGCSYSGLRKFGLTGLVSGEGGIVPLGDSYGYHFHLAHPENSFKGPIAIRNGWLSLHANGAAPVDCAGLMMTNSSLRLYGTETYSLPKATFYGAGLVTNDVYCSGSFASLTKEGAGTLEIATGIGASALVLKEGTVALTGAASEAAMPNFGSVTASAGTTIACDQPLTLSGGLTLAYSDIGEETPVLTVNGALKFGSGATFSATGTKLAKGNYRLVSATGGITGVPTSAQASNSLYVDGNTLMLAVDGGDYPAETANATWLGGGADTLMSTMANWEGTPASLDLTGGTLAAHLGGGAEMRYAGTTWLSRILNDIPCPTLKTETATPLWIKPAAEGARLELTRGLTSTGMNQIVLSGTVSTPKGVDGGTASSGNTMAIRYTPKEFQKVEVADMPAGIIENVRPSDQPKMGAAPLVLANAYLDIPVYVNCYCAEGIIGYQHTTNVLAQNIGFGKQTAIGAMAGSVLDFRGGLTLPYRTRFVGSGATGENLSEMRVSLKPIVSEGRVDVQRYLRLVLDVEGNVVRGTEIYEGLCLCQGIVDFRRSNCFAENVQVSDEYASKDYPYQLEFNTTTQRFGIVRFNNVAAATELRGNYPAMMEVTCQPRSATAQAFAPTNTIPINGGLGVHVCGEGTLPLAVQAYQSCGDLEASAGVLELCAGATWLNGTNFTARGTGVIKFNQAGQINAEFANIRLADSGKISIPAGVTVSAKTVQLKLGDEWITFTDPMSLTGETTGLLAGCVIGGGTLNVAGLPQTGSKLMPLEWGTRYVCGIPYEVEIPTNKLATLGGISENTGFTVYATVDELERPLNVTCLAGRPGKVRLRFTPPTGTTALGCRAGVDTLALADSDGVDNLFAGALATAANWVVPSNVKGTARADGLLFEQTSTAKAKFTYTVSVPEAARGRNVQLELDLTSLSPLGWSSWVSFEQLDEYNAVLPESLSDPRWMTLGRPSNFLAQHKEMGHVHPDARRLRLSITINASGSYDDYGMPITDETVRYARILVSHLAVRVAETLPFPKYNAEFLTTGVSGGDGDRAFVSGGEKAAGFFYQTRSQASWAEAKQMRKEEQFFFPSASGTMEGWFKATSWGTDNNTRYFFSGSSKGSNLVTSGPAINQHLIYIAYKRSTTTLSFGYMDQAGVNYTCSVVRELPLNEWFHVAAQWAPGETAELFLNGERVAQCSMIGFNVYDPTSGDYPNDSHVIEMDIGCESYAVRTSTTIPVAAYPLFDGMIDLCRVSTGKRYDVDGGFTPSTAFVVDADTRAYFDFDRGFDGVSGGGIGWVRASVSSLKDYVSHKLSLGDAEIQFYPDEIPEWNQSENVNERVYHKVLPTVANYKLARERVVECFNLAVGGTTDLTVPATVYPDYVEIANTGADTLVNPIVINAGEVDPRSHGDVRDTLLVGPLTEREKADRVFQYVTDSSDYFMIHTGIIAANTDSPADASYSPFTLLNAFCGFECGPLNTMLQNLFIGSARIPASMTGGYGHSFEQVFYDGQNHLYDQSPQLFFPSMDNEGRAYLEELDNQPNIMHRSGRAPSSYMRHSTRSTGTGTAHYVAKFAPSLRKGERFRVWFKNNGEVDDLQSRDFSGLAVAEDYRSICHANGNLYRVNYFFPEYGNGFLVYDGAVDFESEAFTTAGDSVVYSVDTKFPVVAAEYRAELNNGTDAALMISTDGGTTWRDLSSGKVRYEVRARSGYLVKVLAPAASIARFLASTEVQVNSRSYPGKVKGGANSFTLKAVGSGTARVLVAYRVDAKEIVISGGAYTGTIPGCERQVVVVNPGTPLILDVTGASTNATLVAKGGIAATLANGKLTISSGELTKGFGAVQIVDGNAVKELRVIVSANARLVTAADTLATVSGPTLKAADEGSVQSRLSFTGNNLTARANFASLPAGKYATFVLVRHELRPVDHHTVRLGMTVPGISGTSWCGRSSNTAYDFISAKYGKTESRGRYKWDYPNDPSTSYPLEMLRVYDVPEAFDHLDFLSTNNSDCEVELAAVLVLPIDKDNVAGDEDFQCEAVKQLCGLNSDPWAVMADDEPDAVTHYQVCDSNEPDVTSVVVSNSWVDANIPTGKTITDKPDGENSNGFAYWKSYVLGLTPTNPVSKPIIKGVQGPKPDKLNFTLGNVQYNSASGVKVKYKIKESNSVNGEYSYVDNSETNAGEVVEIPLPTDRPVKYYKVNINYSN